MLTHVAFTWSLKPHSSSKHQESSLKFLVVRKCDTDVINKLHKRPSLFITARGFKGQYELHIKMLSQWKLLRALVKWERHAQTNMTILGKKREANPPEQCTHAGACTVSLICKRTHLKCANGPKEHTQATGKHGKSPRHSDTRQSHTSYKPHLTSQGRGAGHGCLQT